MARGSVSELNTSFGSKWGWGWIRPSGESRVLFFNPAGFQDSGDFGSMTVGQEVAFIEKPGCSNVTRAVRVITWRRSGKETPRLGETHRRAGSRRFRAPTMV